MISIRFKKYCAWIRGVRFQLIISAAGYVSQALILWASIIFQMTSALHSMYGLLTTRVLPPLLSFSLFSLSSFLSSSCPLICFPLLSFPLLFSPLSSPSPPPLFFPLFFSSSSHFLSSLSLSSPLVFSLLSLSPPPSYFLSSSFPPPLLSFPLLSFPLPSVSSASALQLCPPPFLHSCNLNR